MHEFISGLSIPFHLSILLFYYLAIKKNEIIPFAATWMDLEIIILSEIGQTKINIILVSVSRSVMPDSL